jgi:hypothetical protein
MLKSSTGSDGDGSEAWDDGMTAEKKSTSTGVESLIAAHVLGTGDRLASDESPLQDKKILVSFHIPAYNDV